MSITRRNLLKWGWATAATLITGAQVSKTSARVTPYDGKVGVWHWMGNAVGEKTVEELAQTILQYMPDVRIVYIKTSDGADWAGKADTNPNLAIDSVASITKWVEILEANGLEFHAWCVAKGEDITAEVDRIVTVCSVPGVRSMLLDVEPFNGFWTVGREPINSFITQVRSGVGANFHLGIWVDPREQHKDAIFPDEWIPYVDSIHLQCYWDIYQLPVLDVIDGAYHTWNSYGLPVYPTLPGSAPTIEMQEAITRVTDAYYAPSLSWWRMGLMGPVEMPVVAESVTAVERQFG